MEEKEEIRKISPQAGFQYMFVRSNVDVVFGGGCLGGGKSFASILAIAEPSLDGSFRACYTRRNLDNLKTGGGLVDQFKDIFGNTVEYKISDNPKITFQSGASAELKHIADENPKKLMEAWRGSQFDLIVLDELTSYEFTTFTTLITRNRGMCKKFTNKMRATLNPKRSHWTRKWLDWYIGPDGFIMPEREGIVRYFYINGDSVNDVVWGDSKEEVYERCKIDIERKISKLGNISYEYLIKSFTFYQGKITENKAMLGNNMDYLGSVAAAGGKRSQQLIEGNFNVDDEEDTEIPIPSPIARETFTNDPQTNGDRWITCDLADYGRDNVVALAWDGLHIIDIMILSQSTPVMNADKLKLFAAKWDVADCHIIFDGNNARYINDYIPEAIPFISYLKPIGMYSRAAQSLKDEAYLRLVYLINNSLISWDDGMKNKRYYHQNIKEGISIETEFVDECSVVRFIDNHSGKKKLINKKDMNAMLGRGRSMDLLDPIAMRMLPFAQYQYGDELIKTSKYVEEEYSGGNSIENIYDESLWA